MHQNHQMSLEQEFDLRIFADQVKQMSREQAQEFLINLQKTMIIRDNLYREILKNSWGIGKDNWQDDSDPLFSAS